MSRSGYSEDYDEAFPNALALYRNRVDQAIRGRRGQKFLRELVAALDAMPVKELAARTVARNGECCALGCVALRRGVDLAPVTYSEDDDEDLDGDWTTEWLRDVLGLRDCLAREVVYVNDDCGPRNEEAAARWARVRAWAVARIAQTAGGAS